MTQPGIRYFILYLRPYFVFTTVTKQTEKPPLTSHFHTLIISLQPSTFRAWWCLLMLLQHKRLIVIKWQPQPNKRVVSSAPGAILLLRGGRGKLPGGKLTNWSWKVRIIMGLCVTVCRWSHQSRNESWCSLNFSFLLVFFIFSPQKTTQTVTHIMFGSALLDFLPDSHSWFHQFSRSLRCRNPMNHLGVYFWTWTVGVASFQSSKGGVERNGVFTLLNTAIHQISY